MSNSAYKSALITGASSGIGAEFARQLASRGYNLTLVARREERLTHLAEELQDDHSTMVRILPADLSKEDGIQKTETYLESLDGLDLLVNNAGYGIHGQFTQIDSSDHLNMIYVHIIASVRLARAALPGMIARGAGGIINVSSLTSFFPIGSVTYGATKTYLVSFSEKLDTEVRHQGIAIQALCPGFTYSEFHDTHEYTHFDRSRIPKPFWCSSEEVVAESLRCLGNGKVVCIPGRLYRLIAIIGTNKLVSPLIRSFAAKSHHDKGE